MMNKLIVVESQSSGNILVHGAGGPKFAPHIPPL